MASQIPSTGTPVFNPEQLADIHLPEAITFWPLAPGWWLLLALLILFTGLIIWLRKKAQQRAKKGRPLKSLAMEELLVIANNYKNNNDSLATVKQLSIFLRRYVLSLYIRQSVASLTDKEWLECLDQLSNSKQFTQEFSELLTSVPYQAETIKIDTQLLRELFDAAKQLIKIPQEAPDV